MLKMRPSFRRASAFCPEVAWATAQTHKDKIAAKKSTIDAGAGRHRTLLRGIAVRDDYFKPVPGRNRLYSSRAREQRNGSSAKMAAVNERLLIRRQKCCWFAIAALLWCGCADALSPDLTIKELHHTAWGPSQGAPLGGAVALVQTNDGYLWIGGLSALFRIDGIAFERIELPHDPKLSSLRLYSAFAPRAGGLWVGFLFGGVAFLKAGHWQVFSVADGVPPGTPCDCAETPDGTL
jgi:hypothetical protein